MANALLTGWSSSRSGSNFVTRWWHLSRSAIFFGNQWTGTEEVERKHKNLMILCGSYLSKTADFYTDDLWSKNIWLHLTSLVVLTSSAFLLIELTRVLTSERCSSQRTKYSRPWRFSLNFLDGRVSKWWILASNVWNTVSTLMRHECTMIPPQYSQLHCTMVIFLHTFLLFIKQTGLINANYSASLCVVKADFQTHLNTLYKL